MLHLKKLLSMILYMYENNFSAFISVDQDYPYVTSY